MKNAFYFMSKALSVLTIFKIFSRDFDNVGKRLTRKVRLNSKFVRLQTGQQISAIYILPNISRHKGNQRMTFGK